MYPFETEDNNTDFNMHINSQSIQQYQNFGQPSWHSYSIDGMTVSDTYPSEAHTASHQQSRNSSTFTTQGLNYNSHSGSHLSKIERKTIPSERIDTFSGLTSLSATDNINAQALPSASATQNTSITTTSHNTQSFHSLLTLLY
ncbi:predicted protein [Naegleria gruberi]|uniref:Predicted protein n=1 Tax=Naegleria gruberi TaxID=5762 RepID=D2V9K0_NAEGR|nr:uncharacterized protein NAEGRDRAFT_65470 [Naegleria gruberi]EFC46602.1 predicted protein [Naegleria gruberi]|eukprot:XP_002679346.1 predicted protein [Naegleria gruberi strain NEG-M]